MAEVWLIIFVVLLLLELMTTSLVSIWLSLGALIAFFTSLLCDITWIQIIVFFVVSIISLVATRPLVKRYINPKIEKTNYDRVIGKTAVVTKNITKMENGEVKIDGNLWTAKTEDEDIKKDEKVEILRIEGVKLIVRRKEK